MGDRWREDADSSHASLKFYSHKLHPLRRSNPTDVFFLVLLHFLSLPLTVIIWTSYFPVQDVPIVSVNSRLEMWIRFLSCSVPDAADYGKYVAFDSANQSLSLS